MIQAVMVMSTQGKPRLLKFYSYQPPEKHQDLVRGVFQLLSARPDNVSNFVKVDAIFGPGTKLVYKHLATLYFVFVFDSSENELAVLDLVQVFVETLDRCFKNVCELDIVFNFNKAGETVKHNQPHTEVNFRAFQPLSRDQSFYGQKI
uniref:AP complex mu/sigma subunit domain-containing protein n=1 Tax=Leersia perrieri TaxID=77586 RepID=A0A0D9VRI5_9ORYZ